MNPRWELWTLRWKASWVHGCMMLHDCCMYIYSLSLSILASISCMGATATHPQAIPQCGRTLHLMIWPTPFSPRTEQLQLGRSCGTAQRKYKTERKEVAAACAASAHRPVMFDLLHRVGMFWNSHLQFQKCKWYLLGPGPILNCYCGMVWRSRL